MKYRRVLLMAELGADVRPAIAAIRRVAPDAEHLVAVGHLPAPTFPWFSSSAPQNLQQAAVASLDALRDAVAGAAASTDVRLATDLSAATVAELVAAAEIDLVVPGPLALGSLSVVAELRRRQSITILWAADADAPSDDGPLTRLSCVALDARARAAVSTFLRDHGDPTLHVTVFSLAPAPDDLAATLEVAGVHAKVELVTPGDESPLYWLGERARERAGELLVLARLPTALVLRAWSRAPILLLPAVSGTRPFRRRVDVPDLVDDGSAIRARFEYAAGVGRRTPIVDQDVALVSRGRIVAVVPTHQGEAVLPVGLDAESLGVFRVDGQGPDPLAAVEQHVAVIRPGPRPLLLFDADLPDEDLAALHAVASADGPQLLAVRLRPMHSCRSIRARLRAAGLSPRVIDARTVLDEGEAIDVPDTVDAVRLSRVAARMRVAGFPIAAIVHGGSHTPVAIGFTALRAHELARTVWHEPLAVPQPASTHARLDATIVAPVYAGNRIDIELDNAQARRWLIDAIQGSVQRVHLQIYMASDDDIGRQIEAALEAAAGRGVTVRVVVDSLHGFHGSLGVRNPLLERLSSRPGVELRVLRPITGIPSLEDLKQRDHRKIAVVDGRLALIGGRNLSHEYYTGFDEVSLTPETLWRVVPWLDAGARVAGPAVAALDRSFLEAWTDAGGAPFAIAEPAPAGTAAARVVVHHGLRDAFTLEAYLAMIETARSHVYAVNSFPLHLEIQHALLRALGRGVRVRTLFGHFTPTHGGEPFPGPWASARTAATWLVHSRMDALVAAGGEGYQFALAERPGWAPGLGLLHPHVHAKVMSVDGRVCAVGSANMDITGGYWESELLLVVEDGAIAGELEAQLDALMAGSVRVDRDDPAWQQVAKRREWMRHWPSLLSV